MQPLCHIGETIQRLHFLWMNFRMKCSSDKEKENKKMKKMKRIEIAQYIALGATCLTVLGFVLSGIFGGRIPMSMMGYGVMAGIVSYFFGGFGTAVKMAGKIAKWGWLIVPFPYDIVTGMVSFFISIMVFIGLPIIPIRKAYKEQMMDVETVE